MKAIESHKPKPTRRFRRPEVRLSQGPRIGRVAYLLGFALLAMVNLAFSADAAAQEPRDAPWSVPGSWEVVQQEVTFESDGFELSGTLHSPRGLRDGPALVAVQQAGTDTRDNALMVQLAKHFNAIGYSVFLYDRRGHGASEGGPERPDYMAMARDAVAAKRAIATMDEVHSEQVGYWGISQGGWLAMEAGAMSDPAFVIVVGSPLTTPGEQMEVLAYNYVLIDGHGEAAAQKALEVRRAVYGEYFRGELSHDSATALLAEVEDEPWFERTFMVAAEDLPEDPEASPWIREKAYDPVPAFQGVRAPMLFMLGGEDFDIPVRRTLEIADGLEERENREIIVIPGASHVMRIEENPEDQFALEADDASDSTKYFFLIGEWLGRLDLRP